MSLDFQDVLQSILEIQSSGTDIFEILFPGSAEVVYQSMCRNPSASLSISELIQNIVSSTQGLDMAVAQNVCEGPILEDLIKFGSEALQGFVTATSHQEVCR